MSSSTSSSLPTPAEPTSNDILDSTGYCLLSLDGGGVRGLASLYILQKFMKELNFKRKARSLGPKKPCEIFDLMGGTSTGGLIAIMLGRLRMSVEDCIAAYTKLMRRVFEKKENRSIMSALGGVKPRFSAQALADAITEVLVANGHTMYDKFEEHDDPICKVFVCARFQKTNATTRLRSYASARSDYNPTILEAAMATTAAPTYFSSAAIDGSNFVDGAIGANNPVVQVEEEAADIWCADSANIKPLVKCFVSVGTGHSDVRSVADRSLKHLVETLQKVATETEDTNQQFESRWREYMMSGRCFRFNVGNGLEGIKLAEYEEKELIRQATETYLGRRETIGRVVACAENLRKKEYRPTSAFVQQMTYHDRERTLVPSKATEIATSSEIIELIALGNSNLKTPTSKLSTAHLLQARHYFSKALHFLRKDPSAPPKQVSRVCQKLMETELLLSQISRPLAERKEHADQAQEYGEAALENVMTCGDACMVAQVEFMLACVTAWKVYLRTRSGEEGAAGREGIRVLMEMRLSTLKEYRKLQIEYYEEQARTYLGYLT